MAVAYDGSGFARAQPWRSESMRSKAVAGFAYVRGSSGPATDPVQL
jgi:hypothetical protein